MMPLFLRNLSHRGTRHILVVALFVVMSIGISVAGSVRASAYSVEGDYMDTVVPKTLQYRALAACYDAAPTGDENSLQDINDGKWLDVFGPDKYVNTGYLANDQQSCGDGGNVLKWHKAIGFSGTGLQIFCSVPGVSANNGTGETNCNQSTDKFKLNANPKNNFIAALKKVPGGSSIVYDPPNWMKYYIYKKSLETWCGGGTTLTSQGLANNGGGAVSASYVDPNSGTITKAVNYKIVEDQGHNVPDVWQGQDGRDCAGLAKGTRDYAADYSTKVIALINGQIIDSWKKAAGNNLGKQIPAKNDCSLSYTADAPVDSVKYIACPGGTGWTTVEAMINRCGAKNELRGTRPQNERKDLIRRCLVTFLPKDIFDSMAAAAQDVTFEQTAKDAGTGKDGTTCAIDGIGWIVCPVLTFMSKITDASYGIVATFLEFDASTLANKDLKAAWDNFRNIANVLFVIAFLIIIYSQITGAGVSNYGIKKMLPKLIIAAILVNISYYICSIAVDISNILGSSMKDFINSMPSGSGQHGTSTIGVIGEGVTWVAIIATVIVGAAVALLAVSIPVLLAAMLAIAMIVLILMARQALIVLLIVVSPIAFVAYLLPNTEQWFKKWLKLFSSLLLLYPIIAVVFGASLLAARVISNANPGKPMMQIMALGVSAVPFFIVPSLLKGALNATGSMGAKMSGLSGKANGRIGSKVKNSSTLGQRYGEMKAASEHRRTQNRAKRRTKEGGVQQRFDRSRVGRYLGADRGAAVAEASQHKAFDEAVGQERALLSSTAPTELMRIMKDPTSSLERRTAALSQIAKNGGGTDVQSALDYLGTSKDEGISTLQKQFASDIGSKKPISIGGADMGDMSRGAYSGGNFEAKMTSRLFGGKISATEFASASIDERTALISLLSDPTKKAGIAGTPQGKANLALLKKSIADFQGSQAHQGVAPDVASSLNNLSKKL